MPLTPLDIHNREFKRSFRGYVEEEVDEFLDQVIESYEALYKENLSLKETLANKDSNIDHYKGLEDTLKQTLVVAQQTAEEIRHSSEKEAEVLLKEAELKATRIISEAEERARNIVDEANDQAQKAFMNTEAFRKNLQVFKVKFKSFLESQLSLLKEEDLFMDGNKKDFGGITGFSGYPENKPAEQPNSTDGVQSAEQEAAATVAAGDDGTFAGIRHIINKEEVL